MQMNSISYDKVVGIISDVFNVPKDQINLNTSNKTVDTWDSLKHLDLILALEQEFDLDISPEEIAGLNSVETIINLVEQKLVL
jgi:acyl carrier protein